VTSLSGWPVRLRRCVVSGGAVGPGRRAAGVGHGHGWVDRQEPGRHPGRSAVAGPRRDVSITEGEGEVLDIDMRPRERGERFVALPNSTRMRWPRQPDCWAAPSSAAPGLGQVDQMLDAQLMGEAAGCPDAVANTAEQGDSRPLPRPRRRRRVRGTARNWLDRARRPGAEREGAGLTDGDTLTSSRPVNDQDSDGYRRHHVQVRASHPGPSLPSLPGQPRHGLQRLTTGTAQ
jgi:hypothetical protein